MFMCSLEISDSSPIAREGTERWRVPLGPFANLHGMAASPILAGDLLFMLCDQDSESFLLAIHKDSGKIAWRTVRPEAVHGFATPSIFHPRQGPDQIIVPGSYQLTAYSAATGERLWWVARPDLASEAHRRRQRRHDLCDGLGPRGRCRGTTKPSPIRRSAERRGQRWRR